MSRLPPKQLCIVVVIFVIVTYAYRSSKSSYIMKNATERCHTLPGSKLIGSVNGKICKKQTQFHLTKVEKTGSSTLAAIFSRFILEHKCQNVMVMTYGGHLDITKRQAQVPGWDVGPWPRNKADVLVDHARFNEEFIDAHFSHDVKLITSVREPVSWFHSAVRFWGKYLKQKGDDEKLIIGIDIIFLTDQFDFSLILLRRRFCWDHSDILYQPLEVHGPKSKDLSIARRTQLLSPSLNHGEQLLYEAFNATWWSQPEVKDADLWEEVEYFKNVNREQLVQCKRILGADDKDITYEFKANKWSKAILLDRDKCTSLDIKKYPLMTQVAKYALGVKYHLNQIPKLVDYYWWFPT